MILTNLFTLKWIGFFISETHGCVSGSGRVSKSHEPWKVRAKKFLCRKQSIRSAHQGMVIIGRSLKESVQDARDSKLNLPTFSFQYLFSVDINK